MAGIDLGTLQINIQVNGVQQAQSQLNNLNASMQNNLGSMSTGISSLGSSFMNALSNINIFGVNLGSLAGAMGSSTAMAGILGGAVGALTTQFVQFAVEAVQKSIDALIEFAQKGVGLASDLEEIQNVVDVTFENSAEEINKWAKETAGAFGLTEIQAKKYSSSFGAMLKTMGITNEQMKEMSLNLTQLVGDMASFYNLDYEEMFNKLQSGLNGNVTPLRELGINLQVATLQEYALAQGIQKAWDEMTIAEKTMLRYKYILDTTKDSQGDFTRTQESYANQTRILENTIDDVAAAFGSGLMPALTDAKTMINNFFNDNKELITAFGKIIGIALKVIIDAFKVVGFAMQPIVDGLNIIAAGFNKIVDFIKNYFMEPLKQVGNEVKKFFTGVADDVGDNIKYNSEEVEKAIEEMIDTAEEALSYLDEAYKNYKENELKKHAEYLAKKYPGDSLLAEKLRAKELEEKSKEIDAKLALDRYYEEERLKLQQEYTKKGMIYIRSEENGKSVGKWAKIGQYASGTLYSRGGLALVGENGAELVRLNSGDRVYTHTQTKEILRNANSNMDRTLIQTMINKIDELIRTTKNQPYTQMALSRL